MPFLDRHSRLQHWLGTNHKEQEKKPARKSFRSGLVWRWGKETAKVWEESNAPRLGAAVAYYTVFSIAPLFLMVVGIAGLWFGENNARHELFGQLQGLLGDAGAKAIESVVSSASSKPKTGLFATVVAFVTLFAGATGVFVELQASLNEIWGVECRKGSGVWRFIKDRLLSFAMVLGIGFLLLVSLVLSAALSAMGKFAGAHFFGEHAFWHVANFIISLSVITVLFAMILKILPEAKIAWRDVWIGGFITALLFTMGKFLLGFYLGRSTVASAYGAVGSLVILLLWVYYSAQILFFGAAFTRVYAGRRAARAKGTGEGAAKGKE